jgi:type II secretory ATPase GspE/PulE/Tfp pilus assembly ATPase PilB-like protein
MIAEKSTQTSTITDEEAFQDIIATERAKRAGTADVPAFAQLEKEIHDSLARQESESTLALVTRGALAVGSSDIHYDTSESGIRIRLRIDGELRDIATLSK